MTKDIALIRVFGSNLKKYRNIKGLSQRALFSISGIDNAMLSRMENGQVNVTINTLSVLAKALNIHCWELLININQETTTKVSATVTQKSKKSYEKK